MDTFNRRPWRNAMMGDGLKYWVARGCDANGSVLQRKPEDSFMSGRCGHEETDIGGHRHGQPRQLPKKVMSKVH
ncbi:hypothetical protein MAR_001034 [Mya arenaria]|uniref:Uncharacterized protein n=1 Tax=Mya arenaria TaxID=6604 RepID=A0ABY7FIX1_MYAAR|nr:hypothetical protein MAR_001034 [Mya arenaria]